MTSKPYDLSGFKDMLGEDSSELNLMINMFFELTPNVLEEMKIALKTEDNKKLGDLSHKIKSSLRLMGMAEMVELAIQIESLSRSQENNDDLKNKTNYFIDKVLNNIIIMKTDLDLK